MVFCTTEWTVNVTSFIIFCDIVFIFQSWINLIPFILIQIWMNLDSSLCRNTCWFMYSLSSFFIAMQSWIVLNEYLLIIQVGKSFSSWATAIKYNWRAKIKMVIVIYRFLCALQKLCICLLIFNFFFLSLLWLGCSFSFH